MLYSNDSACFARTRADSSFLYFSGIKDEEISSNNTAIAELQAHLLLEFKTRFSSLMKEPVYVISTFLDPALKLEYFKQEIAGVNAFLKFVPIPKIIVANYFVFNFVWFPQLAQKTNSVFQRHRKH